MSLKTAFVIMTPDGEPKRDKTTIRTSSLDLTVVAVSLFDFDKAVDLCIDLVKEDKVQVLMLCPFFPEQVVGRIAQAVGDRIPIFVARGDIGSSIGISAVYAKEGWFFDKAGINQS